MLIMEWYQSDLGVREDMSVCMSTNNRVLSAEGKMSDFNGELNKELN